MRSGLHGAGMGSLYRQLGSKRAPWTNAAWQQAQRRYHICTAGQNKQRRCRPAPGTRDMGHPCTKELAVQAVRALPPAPRGPGGSTAWRQERRQPPSWKDPLLPGDCSSSTQGWALLARLCAPSSSLSGWAGGTRPPMNCLDSTMQPEVSPQGAATHACQLCCRDRQSHLLAAGLATSQLGWHSGPVHNGKKCRLCAGRLNQGSPPPPPGSPPPVFGAWLNAGTALPSQARPGLRGSCTFRLRAGPRQSRGTLPDAPRSHSCGAGPPKPRDKWIPGPWPGSPLKSLCTQRVTKAALCQATEPCQLPPRWEPLATCSRLEPGHP